MKNKRDATPEETKAELEANMNRWNAMNPNFARSLTEWEEKQAEAEAEGYKSEVCGACETIFLAFHHYIRCSKSGCPMKASEKSILEQMIDEL